MVRRRVALPLLPSVVRWVAVLAVAGAIFHLSVVASPPGAPAPGFELWDKVLHFLAYGGLGLSLAYASVGRGSVYRRVLLVVAVTVLYGVGIEAVQGSVPHRYFDPWDAAANGAGGVLSLAWFLIESRVEFVTVP